MCNAVQSLAVSDVQLMKFIRQVWHFALCDTVEPRYSEHGYNGYSDQVNMKYFSLISACNKYILITKVRYYEFIFILNALRCMEARLYIKSRYSKPSFNEITLVKILHSSVCNARIL